MLTQMIIKNFYSIKNETKLSFIAEDYPYLANNKTNQILKGIVFFGDNSSGKTSILLAIGLIRRLLDENDNYSLKGRKCRFSSDDEMEFKYFFEIEKKKLVYYFKFSNEGELLDEWFKIDDNICFKRFEQGGLKNVFNNRPIDNRISFFKTDLNIHYKYYEILKKWKEFILTSIEVMNVGSNNEKYPNFNTINSENNFYDFLKKDGVSKINNFFEKYHFSIRLNRLGEKVFIKRDAFKEMIPFEEESLGLRTLCILLPAIIKLEKENGMLIIDEFSSAFHNKLEELIVRHIMESFKESQFFFVSHSTNLMKNSLLRPDQIFVTEFNEGGSEFKTISSYNPRPTQNIEKMYLAGVFGGLPFYETEDQV